MRACSAVLVLSLSLVAGGDVHAQDVPTPDLESELRMMVAGPRAVDRDRQVVRAFLDRAEVRDAVTASGFDPERLEARVGTLEDGELADLAEQVRSVEHDGDLVGGSTIVISGSTLVIILLLLILLT